MQHFSCPWRQLSWYNASSTPFLPCDQEMKREWKDCDGKLSLICFLNPYHWKTKIHSWPLKFEVVFILDSISKFSFWPFIFDSIFCLAVTFQNFLLTLYFNPSWKWKFWKIKGQYKNESNMNDQNKNFGT